MINGNLAVYSHHRRTIREGVIIATESQKETCLKFVKYFPNFSTAAEFKIFTKNIFEWFELKVEMQIKFWIKMIDWMTNIEKVWALIFTFLGVEGPNEGLQTAKANGPKQPESKIPR